MARKGVYGAHAEKLSRLATLERDVRHIEARKETNAPTVMRLALAAVGGIFLYMAQGSAFWAWTGAAAFMLALAGSKPETGAAAGAITAAIAYFRVLEAVDASGVFWLVFLLYAGIGAVAGSLIALISRRLPPEAFAFLAALLPAGLEHLGSFGASAGLLSTALTQYGQPFLVRISRLGGLAGVTYMVFLFGAAVAAGIRYIKEPSVAGASCGPALGVVLIGFIYGAASGASAPSHINVLAFNANSLSAVRAELASSASYDSKSWSDYAVSLAEIAGRYAERPVVTSAIERDTGSRGIELMVWPEASACIDSESGKTFFTRIESLSRLRKCVQAIGYYDVETDESKAVLTGADGSLSGEYARRRFVHGVDDTLLEGHVASPGQNRPEAINTSAVKMGVLLSLDANYFENFRELAKGGAAVVCVCGYDDEQVRRTSMRLLVFNAARAGVAVVRSAHTGSLAVISADGDMMEQTESIAGADTTLQTSVQPGEGGTVALALGDAFAWLALFVGIGAGLFASSRTPSVELEGKKEQRMGPLKYKSREGVKDV